MKRSKLVLSSTAILLSVQVHAIEINGWTGVGNYGTGVADGSVTLSPYTDSSQYGWVSTRNGVDGVGLAGIGGAGNSTNGSVLTSSAFSAEAGSSLQFYFNYVTSDGAGYADYGWARLLNEDMTQASLLFTARTTVGSDTVPGFSMPAPDATLTPTNTPIISGEPLWSPLGGDSGSCYSTGCGYTDWVQVSYEILTTGNYLLEIGVVNWNDEFYDTGMAFDGATIDGVDINDGSGEVPAPAPLALVGLGLLALGVSRKQK
ncbi:MAG: PEP-CTERM sorting domain-containing protein [Gammaproteobacteria bacterium]|nr:MAG: PEP-CTERM sorting domain-containing protein [Gammaproteobacteria bacterium]